MKMDGIYLIVFCLGLFFIYVIYRLIKNDLPPGGRRVTVSGYTINHTMLLATKEMRNGFKVERPLYVPSFFQFLTGAGRFSIDMIFEEDTSKHAHLAEMADWHDKYEIEKMIARARQRCTTCGQFRP
jgi:hypothetical protein